MVANGYTDIALIVSEYQSEGRGRHGRSFYSPSRTGAYMTLVIHPETNLADAVSITTAAAVAVVRVIETLTDKKPLIKWVNDIYLNDKKICGILTEAVTDFETGTAQSVIVGIGVNVCTKDFPEDIGSIAASLEPWGVTRNQLVAEIASQLLDFFQNLFDKSYLEEYRAHSMVLGRKIDYYMRDKVCHATAIGIDDNGGLIIQNEDGSRDVLRGGEISIRLA
jgi:BirA family biotin operon repressor/biotin-[acetyl-CoA-carboxylase] ligase